MLGILTTIVGAQIMPVGKRRPLPDASETDGTRHPAIDTLRQVSIDEGIEPALVFVPRSSDGDR